MAQSERKPVVVGDVIGGKYRVERELGQGGVGVVVQARHLELHQSVAIKILLLSENEEQVTRFMREARAAVRLRSEHVARVTDVGKLADGTPYMVMEYLEGQNLASLTDRGALPVEDAVAYLLQACEGVAEAHALGLVHRDLKPANLFLTRSSRGRPLVKVLDFGIAKTADTADDDSRLTGARAIIGSPPYMSPEQVRASRDVDVRTDIWSLGGTLYELLTARLPFDGATIQDICARILTEAPTPLEQFRPEVPASLRLVLDRCLAKNRDERYPNVWELAAALEPYAPAAYGTAERVREVLFAAPPPASQPLSQPVATRILTPLPPPPAAVAETQTAFGVAAARSSSRTRRAVGVGVGLAAILAVAGTAVALLVRAPSPAPAPSANATTSTAAPSSPSSAASVELAPTAPTTLAVPPSAPAGAPLSSPQPSAERSAPPPAAASGPTRPATAPPPHRPPPRPRNPGTHPESTLM